MNKAQAIALNFLFQIFPFSKQTSMPVYSKYILSERTLWTAEN